MLLYTPFLFYFFEFLKYYVLFTQSLFLFSDLSFCRTALLVLMPRAFETLPLPKIPSNSAFLSTGYTTSVS